MVKSTKNCKCVSSPHEVEDAWKESQVQVGFGILEVNGPGSQGLDDACIEEGGMT